MRQQVHGARPGGGRDTAGKWPAVLVAAVVLYLACVLALEAAGLWEVTQESVERPDSLLWLPILAPVGALCGAPVFFAAVGAFVLPTLALARRAGRDWWWVPVVAALVALVAALATAALGAGRATVLWLWPLLWVSVGGAALLARCVTLRTPSGARPGLLVSKVAGCGVLAVVVVHALGAAAVRTGSIDAYRPPRLSPAHMTGAWSDGRGGTLRLAGDGTAAADRLLSEDFDHAFGDVRCDGSGTWTHEPADDPWDQTVTIDIGGCSGSEWRISGTRARPKLAYQYGDPDKPRWYTLTRTRGAAGAGG
ncbi:hypothetical protein [Streptomyces sclerotialus]|uniref:hypothetical protein n=1 Tax=Streptomyces sclerotialus TaxID=1957 RepID=UPI0018C9FB6C